MDASELLKRYASGERFFGGANLFCNDLKNADLNSANLLCASFYFADLTKANLSKTNLRFADLTGAILTGANLLYADLRGIDLEDVVLNEAKTDGVILDKKVNFNEELISLANHVHRVYKYVSNEVQTKTSLILPFINLLGYDIHNPCEVYAEYIADFAVRRSGRPEQVDYALFIGEIPVIFIEAKKRTEKPETHDGQLRRYFATSITTKIGIVTNGINYNFFTDIDNQNIMDKNPFFVFNILNYSSRDIEVLKLFIRDNFNIKNPLELLYDN
jgi:uncharacterized protein YjbI with pentapeptide repeats